MDVLMENKRPKCERFDYLFGMLMHAHKMCTCYVWRQRYQKIPTKDMFELIPTSRMDSKFEHVS